MNLLYVFKKKDIKPDDIKNFVPTLLSRMHFEALAYGNIDEKEAVDLINMVYYNKYEIKN